MEEGGVEFKEVLKQPQVEIVDVLNGKYQFHWTSIGKLSNILSRGISSPKFAEQIGDVEFKPRDNTGLHSPLVHVTPAETQIWFHEIGGTVGIIVDVTQRWEVPLRIVPRQIKGLILPDKSIRGHHRRLINKFLGRIEVRRSAVHKRVQQIKEIFESGKTKLGPLPIYGISGDLYWPSRMTHEEIVQMLAEKEKKV